jgi:hypothetical protein
VNANSVFVEARLERTPLALIADLQSPENAQMPFFE